MGETGEGMASIGGRGDEWPMTRLCRLPFLVTAMFSPRLAATRAAWECDCKCMVGNSARKGVEGSEG